MKFFWGIQSIKLKMDLCNSKDEAGLKSYGVGVTDSVTTSPQQNVIHSSSPSLPIPASLQKTRGSPNP
jgi:hypothetical protein